MKKSLLILLFALISLNFARAQELEIIKMLDATEVKNQGMSGTCWCFSIMSLIETEMMNNGVKSPDLSEMFIVRNIYFEKAKNYLLRQGFTRFSEGAFTHDIIPAIEKYGIVPEKDYPNSENGMINHAGFDAKLKNFLDSVLTTVPLKSDWTVNFNKMLDDKFGKLPAKINFEGRDYTPLEFSKDVVKFDPEAYVGLTSFTHHPYYKPFNVEVPDNYSGGLFYNLTIDELIETAEYAVMNGYTVGWDADVSNPFFSQEKGFAYVPKGKNNLKNGINPDEEEISYDAKYRQELFENLTTQDDHLMHLVGIKKTPAGKKYFYVKNSWGPMGPFKGFINVSETYFGINTITLVLSKNAVPPQIRQKLGI
jgi:bleomycin hydrolase